jgi:hypothetical protein
LGEEVLNDNKYPGPVKPHFDDFMKNRKRGEIKIPFRNLERLIEGQKGNHLDVCRRAFIQYLKDVLKEKSIELRIKLDCRYMEGGIKQPSPMSQFCSFKKLDHECLVILGKSMETEDFLKLCKELV